MSKPAAKARSLARRVTMGLLWAAAGGAAIVYGGALVYANVVRLEVDSAVIAGAVEPIRAPSDGVMLGVGMKPGSVVTSGRPRSRTPRSSARFRLRASSSSGRGTRYGSRRRNSRPRRPSGTTR